MKTEIEELLHEILPGFWVEVKHWSDEHLAIKAAASDYLINGVSGQRPQSVSLGLNLNTLWLEVQMYGGNGGQRIDLIPNKEDPKERYLAIKGLRIPFRRPQQTEEAILRAIRKFFEAYKQALKDNIHRLYNSDKVDYKTLLGL